jgi:hypothetical protein
MRIFHFEAWRWLGFTHVAKGSKRPNLRYA